MAIKLKETGSTDGAYDVPYKDGMLHKAAYMTNGEWQSFLDAMPKEARKEYGEGGGDEFSEKNGHPPKMASYGSSSRMIYNLSREKRDFILKRSFPRLSAERQILTDFTKTRIIIFS